MSLPRFKARAGSRPLRILTTVFATVVIAATSGLAFRAMLTANRQRADAIASPPGIEWSGYVNISGVPQWLLIRGEDVRNPILLFVHGGPGMPISVLAGRRYSAGIEKRFVTVHWEQRGAAKSYSAARERTPLTNRQLSSDLDAVSRYLLDRYRRDKLFLIGHSWGSVLGILAVSAHPERYFGFIGVGQFVNAVEQERISWRFALAYLKAQGDTPGYARLAALGEPPYPNTFEGIAAQRRVLLRSGGSFGPNYSISRLLADVLLFPHYTLLDPWRYIKGGVFSTRSMLNESYWTWALDKTHLRFSIPVFSFIGHRDYNTPFALAERYFDAVVAPKKGKVIFEGAAHMIPFEEPERFNREVIRAFASALDQ